MVWGYKIWSLQDEMLCVKILRYLKCEKVAYLYGGIRLWVFICITIIPPIIFIKKVSLEKLKHVLLIKIKNTT